MGDRDDPDDVMETSLTIDYDKQWLNCVSAIGPKTSKILRATAIGWLLIKQLLGRAEGNMDVS